MKLERNIPAHKKIVEFNWCHRNFIAIDDRYRAIRAKSRNPMDSCFWCQHKFVNGEMMALAQPKKGTNKVLCQSCADLLLDTSSKAEISTEVTR